MRRQMNWNCNQAMIMTKLIINLGGDSGGGGGGAELVDGGMSPWAGYCQCFSYSPRPWSRPSSLPPPPSHPLTRRRGRCLAHLPRLLLDSIASCESWFRWSANAGRILHTPCFDKELVHCFLFPALRKVTTDKEICGCCSTTSCTTCPPHPSSSGPPSTCWCWRLASWCRLESSCEWVKLLQCWEPCQSCSSEHGSFHPAHCPFLAKKNGQVVGGVQSSSNFSASVAITFKSLQ